MYDGCKEPIRLGIFKHYSRPTRIKDLWLESHFFPATI